MKKLTPSALILALCVLLCPSAFAQLSPYSDIVLTSRGTPAGGASIAVCANPGLTTTGATVTSNIGILTMSSNPVTAGFVANTSLTVAGFTGADTYFNGSFTTLTVTSTTITFALTHANVSASSNGTAFQTGTAAQACAPLSTIYSDPGGLSPITQPGFTADGLGNFALYASPGSYNVQFYGSTLGVRIKPINVPCIPGVTCVSNPAASLTVTGALNANGGGALNGAFTGNPTLTGNYTATAGQNIANFYSLTGTLWWDGVKYPYTTAGLQQILSDCLASSTCATVHLEGVGVQTTPISSPISFGSTTKSLTVYFERSWNPNCTIVNSALDCFDIHAGTSLIGNGEVPITPNQGLTASSSASVSAMVRVIDQDGSNNVGGLLEGLTIVPNATMTVSDAILSVQNALQVKVIRNVSVSTPPSGVVAVKVFNTAGKGGGNISMENVQFNGGAPPLWIGCANVGSLTLVSCLGTPGVSISGYGSSLVHAQSGFPIIDLEAGNGAGGVNSGAALLSVNDLQIESSFNNTIGILCNGCIGLKVNGLFVSSVIAGADVIKIAQPAGTIADGISAKSVVNQGAWTNTFNDTVNGDTVPFLSCANGCEYNHTKSGANAVSAHVWADASGRQVTIDTNGLTIGRALLPNTAGGKDVGSASLPFGNIWLGGAATNNVKLTATATAARVATFPDASITVSGATGQDCGTAAACSATNISTTLKIVKGSAPLVSGTPSTVTISGISPAFTSSSSYVCTLTDATTATNNLLKVANVSGSSFTITGPNTLTDVINYICAGN